MNDNRATDGCFHSALHTGLVCTSFGSFGGTVYIAASPGTLLVLPILILLFLFVLCTYFDFLDIVVFLSKALLIFYLFFIF